MFEKEAEEYTKENFCGCCPLTWKNQCKNFVNCGYHDSWKDGAEFGYNECKDKLDTAIEIIEQMKDLFFDCWQERGYEAIKFEQKVNDFLKENK